MSNHEVTLRGDVVHKRYARTDRDEPEREWAALVLLEEHAPGLAPRPLGREHEPPAVLMTRVPGEPFTKVLDPSMTAALIEAYRRLFTVPVPSGARSRHAGPGAFLESNVEGLEQERSRSDLPPVVRRALDAARRWHADPPAGIAAIRDPVLAQGDAKVDNALWDGHRFRLVDFDLAGVGDLAFEVADIVEHVSARLLGLRDPGMVLRGFGLDAQQRERVQAYRVVLATMWLMEVLPGNRGERLNREGSAVAQAIHLLGLPGLK